MALTLLVPPSLGHAKAAARAELCEQALSRELDATVTARIAASYAALQDEVLAGEVDICWAPSFVCSRLRTVRGIATIVRDGRSSYRSALVGRKEDALTIGGLVGKHAAWVDALSAGGYLLAVAMLRSRGIDPDQTFASQLFSGSHRSAVEAVLLREADVTAVSVHEIGPGNVANELRWYVGPTAEKLDAIAVTESCPNDAIVLTSRLAAAEAAAILDTLVPTATRPHAGSRLMKALEAERLQRADLGSYHAAFAGLALAATRKSVGPPSR